ncbi:MAG: hypothetical protein UH625_07310 [Muribaculaceae bacterium]|nr:hypothetical protein [Muribaculaceae bacterium]
MKNSSSYRNLWSQISQWSMKAGSASARPVMLLYFVMSDPDLPQKLRDAILSKLTGMFSGNNEPALVPVTETLNESRSYITPEMEQRTDSILGRLTSFYTPFSFK